MRCLLILNPGSRNGSGRSRWLLWRRGLERAGASVETVETESLEHARQLARGAAGFETVVAAGGDGTINAVMAGMCDANVSGQKMGVLYAGTSPDFCRFHRIPAEPSAALDCLLAGKTRRVDAVSISFSTPAGRASSWFGCSCNMGLGAAVAAGANRLRRGLGDAVGTALAAAGAIAGAKPFDADVEIDGTALRIPRLNHLIVLKNPWIASGLKLNVSRRPDDGLLTVVAVAGRNRLGLLSLLPAFYRGSAHRAEGVLLREGSSIRVRCERECEVEFDGDPHGLLPADMETRPRRLELVCGAQ